MNINFFKISLFFGITSFILSLSSCVSRKEITYFQDSGVDTTLVSNQKYNIIFRPGDILTITVSASDIESVMPFNMPVIAYSGIGGSISGAQRLQDYLVDTEGYIDFPILGKIKLGGLNRTQATLKIQNMLEDYVKESIVIIRLINFKISILGEVNRPGSYTIRNERITLPEAIGLAGDLTIAGKRDNVLVIRDINGIQTKTRIDLTSDAVFSSPVYFLAQNDVIYVEPKKAKIRDSSFGTSTSVALSVVSTLISLAILVNSIVQK